MNWGNLTLLNNITFFQNQIIQEVYIQKPSLYRMVLRYVNPNDESVLGKITITPDNPSDEIQHYQVVLKPSPTPVFVTVSGAMSALPSPLVMNPGQWSVSIMIEKSIFLVGIHLSYISHCFNNHSCLFLQSVNKIT